MTTWNVRVTMCVLLTLGVGLTGCSGQTQVKSDLHIKRAPDWVNKGTNILKNKDGRLFHGVGSAPDMSDLSLQTSTADSRARAEVARILSSYMNVVSNDYISATPGPEGANLHQSVSRDIQNMSRVNLAGSRIIGRWRDRKTGIVYALAELDLQHVQKTLDSVELMNAALKAYISEHGDNIFDDMARETQ